MNNKKFNKDNLIDTSQEKENIKLLKEELLLEKNRSELVNQGKRGASYAPSNQYRGKNRYQRRKYSKVPNQVKSFNDIDMNSFFKKDILTVGIRVTGETDEYIVKLKFGGILDEIKQNIKRNNNILDFRTIVTSLTKVFNTGDVYVNCSCPDYKYRFSYWSTINNYNSGEPEIRPADITNPNNDKGSGCKHVLLVLSNLNWMMKIASVINNYIHYMEKYMPKAFADIIFPALYGMKYDKAIQLSLFDKDDLESDESIIDIINEYGRNRTKYKTQPQQSINPRFRKPSTSKKEKPLQTGPTLFDLEKEDNNINNPSETDENKNN